MDISIENIHNIFGDTKFISIENDIEAEGGDVFNDGSASLFRNKILDPVISHFGLHSSSFRSSSSGLPVSMDWIRQDTVCANEVLQLRIHTSANGERNVILTPPNRLPDAVDFSTCYQISHRVRERIVAWSEVVRGRQLWIKGWGNVHEPLWLRPWMDSCRLPTPLEVRVHGYSRYLFPDVDEHAAQTIRNILSQPVTSPLSR